MTQFGRLLLRHNGHPKPIHYVPIDMSAAYIKGVSDNFEKWSAWDQAVQTRPRNFSNRCPVLLGCSEGTWKVFWLIGLKV